MSTKPCSVEPKDGKTSAHHAPADPVANPSPTPDGHKPIPKGDQEVEKFNVTADTGGGD